jgi:CRISPR-associated protein Cas1
MQLHINSYGTYVHIKDELFEIRQKNEAGEVVKKHFAASKVKSIIMTTGSALSTDAIRLAIHNNIDIVFTEQNGEPLGRIWHSKLGSTTKIRKEQLMASLNAIGVKWTMEWVSNKMQNQCDFIKDLKKHRDKQAEFLDDKIRRIDGLILSLQSLKAGKVEEIADTIRGLEGTAGRLYFETLSYVLMKEHQFEGRSSRPAKDPFNAFLNYAYGMLYGRIEKTLIIAGIDPYVGFLHRDDYNQLSMVYDFIEPYRIFSEMVVFRLFSGKKVNKIHTDVITNGCSLNKEGKALLVTALNEYMEEDTIRYKGRNHTRGNAIQFDAHEFANSLIC